MIRGITVIGDIVRPDGKGRPGGTDRATTWLFNAVKRPIHLACGWPVELVTAACHDGIRSCLESSRAPSDAALYWALVYQDLPAGSGIDALIARCLSGKVCVGYELPPYLPRCLDRLGIPWIDIRLHPVRFLDDLLFAVRASEPATQAALIDMSLCESEVIVTAGLREAMGQLISAAAVPPSTLIVVGQRPMDCSQIVNGQFFDARRHEARIAAICAGYETVVLKPHPQPDEPHSLLLVAAAQPNVRGVIADNTYRMLSLPAVSAVLTVNSSIAYEAEYFGKTVHTLAPLPIKLGWRGDSQEGEIYASVDDRVLTGDFWRAVLAPHVAVTPNDGMRLPPKPNRLRIALDSFWNYQQIDTDRIPPRDL
jgi:hypothetical protein